MTSRMGSTINRCTINSRPSIDDLPRCVDSFPGWRLNARGYCNLRRTHTAWGGNTQATQPSKGTYTVRYLIVLLPVSIVQPLLCVNPTAALYRVLMLPLQGRCPYEYQTSRHERGSQGAYTCYDTSKYTRSRRKQNTSTACHSQDPPGAGAGTCALSLSIGFLAHF